MLSSAREDSSNTTAEDPPQWLIAKSSFGRSLSNLGRRIEATLDATPIGVRTTTSATTKKEEASSDPAIPEHEIIAPVVSSSAVGGGVPRRTTSLSRRWWWTVVAAGTIAIRGVGP